MRKAKSISAKCCAGCLVASALLLNAGCPSQPKAGAPSRAWPPVVPPASEAAIPSTSEAKPARRTKGNRAGEETIATVAGSPIPRSAIVDLLVKSHGAGLLEQLIGLEVVSQAAAQQGVQINDADVEREYDLALRKLNKTDAANSQAAFDRAAAEQALNAVLAERNISLDEFAVTLRRNAYLRKIVERDALVSDDMIKAEYSRLFGERVRVRHIQLPSLAEVDRILERLKAGEDFADLASRYSANTLSAREGGMLAPFSRVDEETPEALRNAAFGLRVGEVSSAVHTGQWYHVLRLEERIPAQTPDRSAVRDRLEQALRERLVESRTRQLYEKLISDVSVVIHDPVLKEAYDRRNPPRGK